MAKMTCNLQEAAEILRKHGMPICATTLGDRIAEGVFSFGTVTSQGKTGRRTFLIFRNDLMRWISEKSGGER